MRRTIPWTIGALALAVALAAFKGKERQRDNGLPKEFAEKFALVPMSSSPIEGRVVAVSAFLIAKWEVSNAEYRKFLEDLKGRNDTALLRTAMVDSLGWRLRVAFGEPYIEYYHAHPAYSDYPVVNISHAAAIAYCDWLNERIAAAEGATTKYRCRLPTRDEWIMAGQGGIVLAPYPWGHSLLNEKGEPRCNYRRVGDERISHVAGSDTCSIKSLYDLYGQVDKIVRFVRPGPAAGRIVESDDHTSPVGSYWPNAYGLYNMSGNVAEMIDSVGVAVGGSWINTGYDVRLWSTMAYDRPVPWIGFRPVIEIVQP